jgi:hypothetical protein
MDPFSAGCFLWGGNLFVANHPEMVYLSPAFFAGMKQYHQLLSLVLAWCWSRGG